MWALCTRLHGRKDVLSKVHLVCSSARILDEHVVPWVRVLERFNRINLIQPHITRRKSFNSCRAHSKKFALYSYVCWISEKGRYLNKEKGAIIHVVNTRDTLFGAKLSNSKVLQAGNSQFNSSCLPGFEKGLFLRSKNLISSKWLETNQPILVKKLLLIASIA